jgi:hypothetical protein
MRHVSGHESDPLIDAGVTSVAQAAIAELLDNPITVVATPAEKCAGRLRLLLVASAHHELYREDSGYLNDQKGNR